MRLIDADALDEKLDVLMVRYAALGRKSVAEDYNFVRTVLLTAPTIEVPHWIPVEERLPEKGGYYLVHHKHGLISQRLYYEGQGELFVNVKHDPVTHWMPLPDAPMKEDGNA